VQTEEKPFFKKAITKKLLKFVIAKEAILQFLRDYENILAISAIVFIVFEE